MSEDLTDLFKGDDAALVESIKAALALNRDGSLTPRMPTMATTLLEAAAVRLGATDQYADVGNLIPAVSAERPGREAVMRLWREHGGSQHGPRVETVTMPLDRFHTFISAMLSAVPATPEEPEVAPLTTPSTTR